MDRRQFLKCAGFAAALAGGSRFGLAAAADAPKMNVLFIDIEDMTARAVGCYGNPQVKTPNMDAFAGTGVRFSRCYVQAVMCNPSRTSLLTGLRPDTTRVYNNNDPMSSRLPEWAVSLPELLKRRSVYSINVGKLFHQTHTAEKQLAAFDRLEFVELPKDYRGVSTGYPKPLQDAANKLPKPKFRFSPDPDEEKRLHELLARRNEIWKTAAKDSREYNQARSMFQQPQANVIGDSGLLDEQEGDGRKARMACRIFGELAKDKRQFFISLGFSRPHTPLRCPKKYLDMYDFDKIPAPPAPPADDRNIPDVARRFGANYDIFNNHYNHPVTPEAARRAVHAYYGCASFVDAQIGLVLDTLEREGLADRTIVIIFSDHGFQLGEHNLWSKYTLFEQTTRIPMMVRVPGLSAKGAACDEIIEAVDLVPTLCELLDLPRPDRLESTSFVPLLKSPDRPWKKAAHTIASMARHTGRSVRTKRWRYSEWTPDKGGEKVCELYDLENDPWEQHNLAGEAEYAGVVEQMKTQLAGGWEAALPED